MSLIDSTAKSKNNCPIGVFDSGLGGLTVLSAIHKLMPNEDIVYFGDSGRTPYGTKSKETVLKYTFQDMNFLVKQGVKMIVIACNTASACSLKTVRKHYSLPIVEVVEPGSRAAVKATRNGKVGVIGTAATVASGVYENAVKSILPECDFHAKACPLFVPLVEEGWWNNEISKSIASAYLCDMKESGVDTLVLGCTHYPYLQKVIGEVMGDGIILVNSALEVAKSVRDEIAKNNLAADSDKVGTVSYFTSDSVDKFASLGSVFLGEEMKNVTKVAIDKEWDGGAFGEN